MNKNEINVLQEIVNLEDYPLHKPDSEAWKAVVEKTRLQIAADGCSVLSGFIRKPMREKLEEEGKNLAPSAYYTSETVNAYNTEPDATLAEEHPANIVFQRENAFVARDQIPTNYIINVIHSHKLFKQFLAACFETETLHELSDPLAGLCVNVLKPGRSHPWHFDKNEFTVSMLTKPAKQGGVFEYHPNTRSPENENLADVYSIMKGKRLDLVQQLSLKCGDLQIFKGRFALHRVSEVEGKQERHTAIFAYTESPGVIGSVARSKQLFGRALPAHYAAEKNEIRSDSLLD